MTPPSLPLHDIAQSFKSSCAFYYAPLSPYHPRPAVAAADYACVCLCVCARGAQATDVRTRTHIDRQTDTHASRVVRSPAAAKLSQWEWWERREHAREERAYVCLYECGFFESSVDVAVAVSDSVWAARVFPLFGFFCAALNCYWIFALCIYVCTFTKLH